MGIQDLVRINCSAWKLEISSSSSARQHAKAKALGVLPSTAEYRVAGLSEAPQCCLFQTWDERDMAHPETVTPGVDHWRYTTVPLFFDNGKAMVEIELMDGNACSDLRLRHISQSVCDSFSVRGNCLRGLLDFRNDLGDFELCWEWLRHGKRQVASFRFTVYSTKLDLENDFRCMLEQVQGYFQWLRLDLLRQTQWGLASADAPASLQSWLAVFRNQEQDLLRSYQRLVQRHRRRLQSQTGLAKAEHLRRMTPRLEEEVERWNAERPEKLHRYECQVLDPDTMENRFVKAALRELCHDLGHALAVLEAKEEVADSFRAWLGECLVAWRSLSAHPFWKGIGEFRGWRQESLALARDPLYARIAQGWKLLRKGLRFALLERFAGGMQSVDQLYEAWCLVQLHQVLAELEWEEDSRAWNLGNAEWDDLRVQRQAAKASFVFKHPDRGEERLYLLYQPFTDKAGEGWEDVSATPVPQNPDLVLRLACPGRPTQTWIFDAKYRVEPEPGKTGTTQAPCDALNQMHRYRDAILWTQESWLPGERDRVREPIGAYVLFPGRDPNWAEHAQFRSIQDVNIGAFQLHPSEAKGGREVLTRFLERKLAREGWDMSTPLPKGLIPVEAKIFFAPDAPHLQAFWKGNAPLFWVPWKEVETVLGRGQAIRDCTHLAIRSHVSAKECVASFALTSRHRVQGKDLLCHLQEKSPGSEVEEICVDADYLLLGLGDKMDLGLTFLESMPSYGIMAWNRW